MNEYHCHNSNDKELLAENQTSLHTASGLLTRINETSIKSEK